MYLAEQDIPKETTGEEAILHRLHSYFIKTAPLRPEMVVPEDFSQFYRKVKDIEVMYTQHRLKEEGGYSSLKKWISELPTSDLLLDRFPLLEATLFNLLKRGEIAFGEYKERFSEIQSMFNHCSWRMTFKEYYEGWSLVMDAENRDHELSHLNDASAIAKQIGIPLPRIEIQIVWFVVGEQSRYFEDPNEVDFCPMIRFTNIDEMFGDNPEKLIEFNLKLTQTLEKGSLGDKSLKQKVELPDLRNAKIK